MTNLPDEIERQAKLLKHDDDSPFSNDASLEQIVHKVVKYQVSELQEDREAAQEKQEELREKMGVDSEYDEDADKDDVAEKQAGLRDRITGGN